MESIKYRNTSLILEYSNLIISFNLNTILIHSKLHCILQKVWLIFFKALTSISSNQCLLHHHHPPIINGSTTYSSTSEEKTHVANSFLISMHHSQMQESTLSLITNLTKEQNLNLNF